MAQQNLDFNIVAHTKGMEAIASLINRVGALETEIKKVQQANAGLAASSDAVIRNGVRYNNAMDAQAKALRNARQGTQQLGMQINDFATSVSTGASPIQAFNQQLGQLGFAMSMMGGTAGRVGAFLAGPWGAAIVIATMALGSLFESTKEEEQALEDLDDALNVAELSAQQLAQMNALLSDSNREVAQTALQAAQALQTRSRVRASSAESDLQNARTELNSLTRQLETLQGAAASGGLVMFPTLPNTSEISRLNDRIKELQTSIPGLQREARNAESEVSLMTAAMDEQEAAIERLTARQNDLRNAFVQTGNRDFLNQAIALQGQIDALGETTDRAARSARSHTRELTQAEVAARALFRQYENGTVSVRNFIAEVSRIGQMEEQRRGAENFVQQVTRISDALETSRIQGDLQAVKDDLNSMNMEAALTGQNLQQVFLNANPLQVLPAVRIFSTEMQQAFADIGASVDNAFKGMLTGAMGWKDAMRGIIQSVIDQLWKMYVTQKIVGFITGALGKIGVALPAKAAGGSVNARTPYMVGEKGPELFIPGGNGTIIPNKNVGGGSSGNVISINVDARGATDAAAVRAQVQRGILEAAPSIIAAAQQKTVSDMRRPRLGGVMQ